MAIPLPNELIEKIVDYLPPPDYNNMELNLKSINNNNLTYIFSKTFFQTECNECITIIDACKADHVRCLEYLLKRQNRISLCSICVIHGAINCLKYARIHGYPWDKETCEYAASSGHLDYIEYAHTHGCPWDEKTCENAASFGHLDCLMYAHENGCPWDERTYRYAAHFGYLDCLEYAHENGCPR